MSIYAPEDLYEKFKEFFLSAGGTLRLGNSSIIDLIKVLSKEKELHVHLFLKELGRSFYLTGDKLTEDEKKVFVSSPWFPELRLNLKYPTVFDLKYQAVSPNSSWRAYLREEGNSFLIYDGDTYITELELPYKVESFCLWKDYLALIDQDKTLRVIYLFSLKEVFSKKKENYEAVLSREDSLYLIYQGVRAQYFVVNELGVDFGEIANEKEYYEVYHEFEKQLNEEEVKLRRRKGAQPHKLSKFLRMDPYLIFLDEKRQAHVWVKKRGEGFIYKGHLGKISPSEDFKELNQAEGWRIDKDFALFKKGKVCGSKGFEKHINVLLGGMPQEFDEFKDLVSTKPLEVLK